VDQLPTIEQLELLREDSRTRFEDLSVNQTIDQMFLEFVGILISETQGSVHDRRRAHHILADLLPTRRSR